MFAPLHPCRHFSIPENFLPRPQLPPTAIAQHYPRAHSKLTLQSIFVLPRCRFRQISENRRGSVLGSMAAAADMPAAIPMSH